MNSRIRQEAKIQQNGEPYPPCPPCWPFLILGLIIGGGFGLFLVEKKVKYS